MRTLVGVLLVLLVLVPLAAVSVRGGRRVDSNGQMEDAGRTSVRLLVEGLVVLAVIVVGVVVVVALLD